MFDSHCHLHDERLLGQADAAMARARAAGVSKIMLAGVCPEGWRVELELAQRYPECLVSYGVHPQLAGERDEHALSEMVAALERALAGDGWPAPHALGEIGLDRSTPALKRSMEVQERIFRRQLELARRCDLPVLLHVLEAHGRALELLEAEGLPAAGGVVHSYSGPPELVADYERLGLYISFTGIVCQPNARRARASAARVSPARLLVETDAPDQTPLPLRPAQNEPAFLPQVIAELSALRGTSAGEIAALTEQNARRLFRIDR